ncbi:MAG TPA: hypothetical protein VIK72_19020 [Clostridiaceae bacterium]
MSEKIKRILMTVGGVSISGFSVGMFNLSDFGMDPFQVLAHGIWNHIPLGFGTLYMIINLIMLAVVFLVDRHKIGLGTFINIFLLGYIVQFSSWLFNVLIPSPSLSLRVLFLIGGIVIICFASSIYYTGDMGVSTYDAVALILSEKKVARFKYCRIGCDLICALVGFLLGAIVGIGTLVTAFFMGPLITFFNHHFAMPFRYGKVEAKKMITEEKNGRKQKPTSQPCDHIDQSEMP